MHHLTTWVTHSKACHAISSSNHLKVREFFLKLSLCGLKKIHVDTTRNRWLGQIAAYKPAWRRRMLHPAPHIDDNNPPFLENYTMN